MTGRRLGVVALLCVLMSGSALAATVSGLVFLDANRNGKLDRGESGLVGVPVPDGMKFVLTSADGSYKITLTDDPALSAGGTPTVSIGAPSGKCATTPWFRRVSKTEPDQTADFGLRVAKQSLPFVFIHGTDPHVPRAGKDKFINFRKDIEKMGGKVKFCFLTGDLVDLADSHSLGQCKSEYDFFGEQTRDFPVPLFCTPGNHDIAGVRASKAADWDKKNPLYGYGFYTKYVGPLRWSFDYAGIHFVGVDYQRLVKGKWRNGVSETAAGWLEDDLKLVKPGTRILLFVHFPEGDRSFSAVVRRYKVEQIFTGHHHTDRAFTYNRVPVIISGSIAQVFSDKDRQTGYRIVNVTEKGLDMFYRATGDPHAITIDFPRPGDTFTHATPLRGAFYDPHSEITKLTVKVGGHEEKVQFERGPIKCSFNAKLKLEDVAEGIRPLAVAVTDGKKTWQCGGDFLTLTGHQAKFAAIADAVLELDLGGIDIGAELRFNGEKLIGLKPTGLKGDNRYRHPVKGTEVVAINIPKAKLRRLNMIELLATKKANERLDSFCLLDVRMKYAGKTCRDVRFPYGPRNPNYVTEKKTYWIDLTPGK